MKKLSDDQFLADPVGVSWIKTDCYSGLLVNPDIFGSKPILRGRRLAVEYVLGMLAAGDTPETILSGYPWLEPEDIQACLVYACCLVRHE